MRTVTQNIYTAAELREAHPKGFAAALERHRQGTYDDPAWIREHRESLAAALKAIGDDPPAIDGARRVMAWCENHVLAPLRVPFAPLGRKNARSSVARYGSNYRAGCVKPCPWTGYYLDDALLECIVKGARNGDSPAEIRRDVEALAERLWNDDIESQCTEEYFIDAADANKHEFLADGSLA